MPRDQMGVIPEMEGWFNTQKKIDAQNMPCRQAEGENLTIVLTNAGKAFDTIQRSSVTKRL